MASDFNPYSSWLQIPLAEQPPNHYRLIGVDKYEADPGVIALAADRCLEQLRGLHVSERADAAQRLISEVAIARFVLTTPDRKAVYDRQLKAKERPPVVKPLPVAKPLPEAPPERGVSADENVVIDPHPRIAPARSTPGTARERDTDKVKPLLLMALGGVGAGMITLLVACLFIFGNREPQAKNPKKPPPVASRKESSDSAQREEPRPLSAPPMIGSTTPEPWKPEAAAISPAPPPVAPTPPPAERVSPRSNYCVRLRGPAHVEVLDTKEHLALGRDFTVEVWARWQLAPEPQTLFAVEAAEGNATQRAASWRVAIKQGAPGFEVIFGDKPQVVPSAAPAPDDTAWHHVALCGARKELALFVDGKRVASKELTASAIKEAGTDFCLGLPGETLVGDNAFRDYWFLRISSGVRYTESFEPTIQVKSDDTTLALFDFRSMQGQAADDLSGNRRIGKLFAANWVDAQSPEGAELARVTTASSLNLLERIIMRNGEGGTGRIQSSHGKLLRTLPEGRVIVPIDCDVPESYELALTALRKDSKDLLGIGLVVGGRQTMMIIDGYGAFLSGLDLVGGKRPTDVGYPDAFKGPALTTGTTGKLRIVVHRDKVTVHCDGDPIYSWSGDASQLGVTEAFHTLPKPGLFIASLNSTYEITEFRLTPLDPSPPAVARVTPKLPAAPSDPVAAKRAQPPDSTALAAAHDELRRVMQSELDAAKKPDQKLELALKLGQLARDSKDDPAARYVLFEEAVRLAAEAAHAKVAFAFLDEQASHFDLDEWKAKAKAVAIAAPIVRAQADRKQLSDSAVEVARGLAAGERFEDAAEMLRVASAKATDSKQRAAATKAANEVEHLKRQWQLAQVSVARLQEAPDDPKANLAYGKYLCLVRRDWAAGLENLRQGSDPALRAAAEADLAEPVEADDQIAVGDQWWEAAQTAPSDEAEGLLARADVWYRRALPQLSGLKKERIEKRLSAIRETVPATVRTP